MESMNCKPSPTCTFQDLPWNIAAAIIKHLADGQNAPLSLKKLLMQHEYNSDDEEWYLDNNSNSDSQALETGNDVLVPLLQSCKRWQLLVYKHLCATCSLTISYNPEHVVVDYCPPLPKGARCHNTSITTGLSNKLLINVDYSSILNGRALGMLMKDAEQFNTQVFNSVTHVSIIFKYRKLNRLKRLIDPEQHIQAFVDYLKLNTPRLRIVNVCINDQSLNTTTHNSLSFADLFISLLNLCPTACLSMNGHIHPNTLGLICLETLASLDVSWNASFIFVSQIIHNNANCLQSLNIGFEHTGGIRNLIFSSIESKPTIFPRLRTLNLTYCGSFIDDTDYIFRIPKQYQLFPALAHLRLDIGCLFDDIFLRGNQDTLETLVMMSNKTCVNMLISCGLNSGQFKKLHSLKIFRSNKNTFDEHAVLTLRKSAGFAFGIAPNLSTLELDGFKSGKYFVPKLRRYTNHLSLRIVKLSKTILPLDSMLEILRLLPSLTDLHCSFPAIIDTNSLSMDDYLKQLDSIHTPLSTAFKCLNLTANHMVKVNAASQIGLILAILCPCLSYVMVSEDLKEEFGLALCKNIASSPFSPYRARVSALINWRVRNGCFLACLDKSSGLKKVCGSSL